MNDQNILACNTHLNSTKSQLAADMLPIADKLYSIIAPMYQGECDKDDASESNHFRLWIESLGESVLLVISKPTKLAGYLWMVDCPEEYEYLALEYMKKQSIVKDIDKISNSLLDLDHKLKKISKS